MAAERHLRSRLATLGRQEDGLLAGHVCLQRLVVVVTQPPRSHGIGAELAALRTGEARHLVRQVLEPVVDVAGVVRRAGPRGGGGVDERGAPRVFHQVVDAGQAVLLEQQAGVGLVEVYDLDRTVDSTLGNISTRGFVQTGDNVLIAGTIVLGSDTQRVLVRGIGPSLSLPGKLADPTLELRDSNGALIRSDDNWRTGGQEAEIIATGIPPTDDLESALIATLPSNGAAYTAILRGTNASTGIAVVEVYALQ